MSARSLIFLGVKPLLTNPCLTTRLIVGALLPPNESNHRLLFLPFTALGGGVTGFTMQACSSDFWLGFASRGAAFAFHIVCTVSKN